MLVSALSTWCEAESEEPLKLASPEKETERLRAPAELNESEQLPAPTAAEQDAPAPSSTVTLPVGVPAPGATTETDQDTETGWPTTEGLGVIGGDRQCSVSALSTWCEAEADEPLKSASPAKET